MLSKNNTCTDPLILKQLDDTRGVIRSSTGGWFPGKGVFSHGYSMLEDLVGKKTYFQILILNATGKMVDRKLADWVEACYGCLSWPDPRIWCNQVGALAGVANTSVVAATCSGVLASDSKSYGPSTLKHGVKFISTALQQFSAGKSAEDIITATVSKKGGKPFIVGYIRPIAKGDERLEAMEKVSKELGFTDGQHLKLAYEIEKELLKKFDEGMNINGYASAFLSDKGFTSTEIYQIFTSIVMSGVTACFLETSKKPNDFFLPLRCNDIEYKGQEARVVPET